MSIFMNEWNILLVDDEPDVLNVSKLAMHNFEVNGRPLKLFIAESKAEALDLLSQETKWASTLAVAFIDVVMESDTAGLELCKYIREDLNNDVTQLFIRTGQPGIAPERAVIDRYDINGYFTKAEVTEDKLYSLVKSGVHQYLLVRYMQGMMRLVDGLITAGDSRQHLSETLERILKGYTVASWDEPGQQHHYFAVNGQSATRPGVSLDKQEAMVLKEKLDKLEGTPLGSEGDNYVIDENNNMLISIVAKPYQPEAFLLLKETAFGAPENIVNNMHFAIKNMVTLWGRAS